MKTLATLFSLLLLTSTTHASELACDVIEYYAGKSAVTNQLSVPVSENSHGDLATFVGHAFSDVRGFVSLLKKGDNLFAVISLYSESTKVNSSGQTQLVVANQYIQQQIIIPSDRPQVEGVEVQCYFISETGK